MSPRPTFFEKRFVSIFRYLAKSSDGLALALSKAGYRTMNPETNEKNIQFSWLKEETRPVERDNVENGADAQNLKSGLQGEAAVVAIWGRFEHGSVLCQK